MLFAQDGEAAQSFRHVGCLSSLTLSDRPMMVVRGEHSTLLTEQIVASMQDRHPELRVVTAAGQGHAPLLHKPQVCDALLEFLRTV